MAGAALAGAAVTPAHATDPLSPNDYAAAIGPEIAYASRAFTLAPTGGSGGQTEVAAEGPMGGLYAYMQLGSLFRSEARILGGTLTFDEDTAASGRDEERSEAFGGVRATIGVQVGTGRLYLGAGGQRHETDIGPDAQWNSLSLYVPVGYAGTNHMGGGWWAQTTLEARFIVDGEEEFTGFARTGGDGEFERSGGYGARLAFRFRKPSAGIEIQPYIDAMQPDDTAEGSDGAQGQRLEELSNVAAGLRFNWVF